MAWVLLIVAGLFEIVWAIGLKYADGFTCFWPSVVTVVAMLVSIVLLGYAMKSLPVGNGWYESTWKLPNSSRVSRKAVGSTEDVLPFPEKT